MATATNRVVVVGGSLAGQRFVAQLVRRGYTGEIVVVSAEAHLPYDRPPLSKKVLAGEWEPDRIILQKRPLPDNVQFRTGVAATGLDPERRAVQLADGTELVGDAVLIATGTVPKRVPGQRDHPHVHELRTLDDSLRLRAELAGGGKRVAVVGAGFIGLEVAATARGLGNEVTVFEGAPAPLIRGLGAEQGAAVATIHDEHDVAIRCGVSVDGLTADGLIVDGEPVAADVVVMGIGVRPATDWLADSGLTLDDGVVCSPDLNAGFPGISAAGDIVRWDHPLFDERLRIEHWTNATEQGMLAADNLLAATEGAATTPSAAVPYFWSDQYDCKLQFVGRAGAPGGGGEIEAEVVAGSVAEHKYLTLFGHGGRLRGVLGINMPRHTMAFTTLLSERGSWDDAVALARTL